MSARLLDGKAIATTIQAELAAEVTSLVQRTGVRPGLAAVLVGDNHPGRLYVRNKQRACEAVGMTSWLHEVPSAATQDDLLVLIARLNADPAVHGILVQLPLPDHFDEAVVTDAVLAAKDVDGFGPENLGLLSAGRPRFLPCTPHGVLQMLQRSQIDLVGKNVVIVGRSNIVGKPLALLLAQKGVDATVTLCHSRTRNLAEHTRRADIVVVAIGQPHFLKADMIQPGAIVIDVGTNRLADGSWAGDVDFERVREVASLLTPVPGGVGPMTIAMLLVNTLAAARGG